MAEYSGKDLYIKLGGTVLNTDYREFKTSESIDEIDATAGADTRKNYLAGPADGEFTLRLLDTGGTSGSAGTALWGTLAPGISEAIEWGPAGTIAGYPKYSGTILLTKRDRSIPYNDVVSYEAGGKFTTAITGGTY